MLSSKNSLYILDTRVLSDISENISSHSVLTVFFFFFFFDAQHFGLFFSITSNLSMSSFVAGILLSYVRIHYQIRGHRDLLLYFLLRVLYFQLLNLGHWSTQTVLLLLLSGLLICFSFQSVLEAWRSSWARDQTCARAATLATAITMLDP